jgi:signal transduction histidine kinase
MGISRDNSHPDIKAVPWLRKLLGRWAASLILAVLVGTVGVVVFVEGSISSLRQVLPVEVLRQERDLVLMLDGLIALQSAAEKSAASASSEQVAQLLGHLEVVERQLEGLREAYDFDTLTGAASMYGTLYPVVSDIRIWLRNGVEGLPPSSPEVLTLVADRIAAARQDVRKVFVESNGEALAILQQKANTLERFRGSLVLAMIFVASLAVVLITFVLRQRRSDQVATAARQRMRDAIDSIPGGFALFDAKERLIHCNDRYGDLYPGARDLLQPGRRFEDIVRAAAKSGEIIGTRRDTEAWVLWHLASFRNPDKPIEVALHNGECYRVAERQSSDGGFVIVSASISELRQREKEISDVSEELRHKNVLLDAALSNMGQGLAMFGEDLRLIICNQRFLDLYQLSSDEVRPGATLAEICNDSARIQGLAPEAAETFVKSRLSIARSSRQENLQEFLANGGVINILHRPLPGGGSLATYEDVTGNYSVESQLRSAKEEAELANRAKSDFLANVSHELRTPLNAVIGFSEIIKKEFFGPLGNHRYREYANDIHDSGIHLLSLINDILDLSKIEAGKFELLETPLDLPETVIAAFRLMRDRAIEASVTLEMDIPEDLPNLMADTRSVKQILLNLLSNAVKFTGPGGWVRVSARIGEDGGMRLEVEDNGIGIAEEDIEKAMAPFGQVDSSLSRKYEGTGLGLPLTRHLADLHGGSLNLDSTLDEGTKVTISFPGYRVGGVKRNAESMEHAAAG